MPRSNTMRSPLRRSVVDAMAGVPFPRQFGRTALCGTSTRLTAGWLTNGKSANRRRDIGGIPIAEIGKDRVCQRAGEVSPYPRLVPQIMRLAVASMEPRKGAEQPRVALCRHDGVKLGKARGIEVLVRRAPRLDVARQQR